jgi:hypothetical protein
LGIKTGGKETLKKAIVKWMGAGFLLMLLTGCSSGSNHILSQYSAPQKEADWIIQGHPIEFEGELWYPQDNVDNFLDSEVALLGEYQGVQFFSEKVDVRPYERLYTKFGPNKFRAYTKRAAHDKGKKSI